MAQLLTIASLLALGGYLLWHYADRLFERRGIHVSIRLDRDTPGAHLIWEIVNNGERPVTLTKLIAHGKQGSADGMPTGLPRVLAPQERMILPIDVDWSLLAARSIAVVDIEGREHPAGRRELAAIQQKLQQVIDRRADNTSARDFLTGAADLAFGVVILGLGFFMLMWVIATG